MCLWWAQDVLHRVFAGLSVGVDTPDHPLQIPRGLDGMYPGTMQSLVQGGLLARGTTGKEDIADVCQAACSWLCSLQIIFLRQGLTM